MLRQKYNDFEILFPNSTKFLNRDLFEIFFYHLCLNYITRPTFSLNLEKHIFIRLYIEWSRTMYRQVIWSSRYCLFESFNILEWNFQGLQHSLVLGFQKFDQLKITFSGFSTYKNWILPWFICGAFYSSMINLEYLLFTDLEIRI